MAFRGLLFGALFLFLHLAVPTTVAGGQRPADPAGLAARVRPDDTLTVVDAANARLRGRLVAITPTTVTLTVNRRPVTVSLDLVREVRRCCDSIANGTLIGAASLGIFGFLGAMGFSGETRVGDGFAGLFMFGSIGAGLGAGLDAVNRGEVVVFRAPSTASRGSHGRPAIRLVVAY